MTVLVVAVATYAIILLAELPDKTALASLLLGTRYPPVPALCGIVAAFTVHVVLAVVAGSLLGLLPHTTVEIVVSALFLSGALFLLLHRSKPEEHREPLPETRNFRAAAAIAFVVILVAEFGDLTQVVIANLVARYHNPIAVGIAADLALSTVATLAIIGGRGLLRVVPMAMMTRLAAGMMIALAGFSLAAAFA